MLYHFRVTWRWIIVTLKSDHWRSSKLVPFESFGVVSYLPSIVTMTVSLTVYAIFSGKNSVTLKTGLGVVQGHWKWRRSIDHNDFLLASYCKYSSILYRFSVIQRWIISWPWNLGQRSPKVIQTGTIRKFWCGFLLAFHSNYGSILHQFPDKARYWSQIVIFSYPLYSVPPLWGSPLEYCRPVWCGKTRVVGYPIVKKTLIICVTVYTQYRRVTDGRTDRRTDILPRHSPRYTYASRGKKGDKFLDHSVDRSGYFSGHRVLV